MTQSPTDPVQSKHLYRQRLSDRSRTMAVRSRTLRAASSEQLCETVPQTYAAETEARNLDSWGCHHESLRTVSTLKAPGSAPFLGHFLVKTQLLECGWRPEPESNRRARICSPLRNHSAIGPREAHVGGFAAAVKGDGPRATAMAISTNGGRPCLAHGAAADKSSLYP